MRDFKKYECVLVVGGKETKFYVWAVTPSGAAKAFAELARCIC